MGTSHSITNTQFAAVFLHSVNIFPYCGEAERQQRVLSETILNVYACAFLETAQINAKSVSRYVFCSEVDEKYVTDMDGKEDCYGARHRGHHAGGVKNTVVNHKC